MADRRSAMVFVLLAAASVALGSVIVQRVHAGVSSEGMVAWSTALGAVRTPSASCSPANRRPTRRSLRGILAAVYLAVFASAVYLGLVARPGAIETNPIRSDSLSRAAERSQTDI